jgi:hypothetical protein
VRAQLFRQVAQNFQPTDDPALSAIDFDVTGSIDKPRSNLVDRLVGRQLKNFGSVVDMLLGRDKDKPAPAAPTASPQP